jgi:internalin A
LLVKEFALQDFLKGLEGAKNRFSHDHKNKFTFDNNKQLVCLAINPPNVIDFTAISKNTTLRWLNLHENALLGLPDSISKLDNLIHFNLSSNNLTKLPKSIGKLKKLELLHLNSNNLTRLPESIGELEKLKYLDLNSNNLTRLPESISKLQKLELLDLSSNNLTNLPESISKLKNLRYLTLSNNPIAKYLKGIKDYLSTQELITYLLEVQHKNTKPLNEAKVLVVGDERVGKTSLIKRILGDKHNPNQHSTEGIDIHKRQLSNDIQVNIWDFAGQEITHQTHQFFLSTRSLYLYVLDSQKEDNDSDIYHWLSVIKANGGDSPIIVVVNKRDLNTGYSFNLNRYKDEFNIVEVLYLSAENDEAIAAEVKQKISHNIDDLTRCIEQHVEKLEDIKFPLPPRWAKVKDELEAMSTGEKDYIESDDYETLCHNNGIENPQLQDTLLTILNQIGTVVTYKDNHRLSVMQIINPLWVTNGVYKIIRSPLVDINALLSLNQFKAIFAGEAKYRTSHYNWLKDLLNQFELSFSIDDETILLPSKLSPNQPDFTLAEFQTGLNFKYSYQNLLKKSVISQFIVKMKDYITSKALKYWQRGVFLQHGDCNGVVIADEETKTITIAIDTSSRSAKELLTIIRHTIRSVSGTHLRYDEQVPLMLKNQLVGYADYDHLTECEREGDEHIRLKITSADKKNHRFAIADLLDGYRIKDDTHFDYHKLTKDFVTIALLETENRHTITNENEDQTNDRFKTALVHRKYIVGDQSRGGTSATEKSSGERDLLIRNNQTGVAESVIEAFILKQMNSKVINSHYQKLVNNYDTTGNQRNFILVYAKSKNFAGLWKKYQKHFSDFEDTSDTDSPKDNVKTGKTTNANRDVWHIFVNFGV